MQNYNFGIIYIIPMCLHMEILHIITMKRTPYLIRSSFASSAICIFRFPGLLDKADELAG